MGSEVKSIRIAIADDHELFRDGLRALLKSERGFEVIGESADGLSALQVVRDRRPDVLLLDVAMPRLGGLEALPTLAQSTRVILLTAAIDAGDVFRAIQAGARGVVLKESATRRLIDSIHRVMAGQYVIGAFSAEDLAAAIQRATPQQGRRFGLTIRELEVVACVVAGESNREISLRLEISAQTVKHHLTSIFDKTGVSSRLELALFAIRQNLVEES